MIGVVFMRVGGDDVFMCIVHMYCACVSLWCIGRVYCIGVLFECIVRVYYSDALF